MREAAEFPVLKIKVGLDSDEATIDAVRSVTGKPLRVDANEGWKDKETAIRRLEWLSRRGVELVEQPMPAAMLEEAAWLKARSPIPLFADEACLRASDIPGLRGTCHGINVKLDKAGGLREALRMIHTARACGLQILLGCMVSSSVSTTAAAHLSPLVDFADLDGHLLVTSDPWEGVAVRDGRLLLNDRPGSGSSGGLLRASASALGREPRHVGVGGAARVDADEPGVLLQEAAQVHRRRQELEAVLLEVFEVAQADLADRRDLPQRHAARLAHAPQLGPREDLGQLRGVARGLSATGPAAPASSGSREPWAESYAWRRCWSLSASWARQTRVRRASASPGSTSE